MVPAAQPGDSLSPLPHARWPLALPGMPGGRPWPGAAGREGAGKGEAAPDLSGACRLLWSCLLAAPLWRGWFDVPATLAANGSWDGLTQGTSGEVVASGQAEMLPQPGWSTRLRCGVPRSRRPCPGHRSATRPGCSCCLWLSVCCGDVCGVRQGQHVGTFTRAGESRLEGRAVVLRLPPGEQAGFRL